MRIPHTTNATLRLATGLVLGLASTYVVAWTWDEDEIERQISFHRDVYPILDKQCVACHTAPRGRGYRKTGLDLETYEGLMRGTRFGRVIRPGDSRHSILNMLVEGRADPSVHMPCQNNEPLRDRELEILRLWVEQGARNN